MPQRFFFWSSLLLCLTIGCLCFSIPAQASNIDPYVTRYLRITAPISLEIDSTGEIRSFSPQDLSRGKQLFEENCKTCHVGGATLPNPLVSLALADLHGATPPRDSINSLVAYMREPMTYDGAELMDWCRRVPEHWLSQPAVETLAAFILTAAQKAPGWGTKNFE
jgi:photosystem II cytochrome c550